MLTPFELQEVRRQCVFHDRGMDKVAKQHTSSLIQPVLHRLKLLFELLVLRR